MSDVNQNPVKSLGVFSALEAAMQIQFCFLAIAFILWVDNVFLYLHQPGIAELIKNPELQNLSLPLNLVLMFVAFSLASSIALPFFSYITEQIYLEFIWGWIEKFFGFSSRCSEMPRDCVSAYKLREVAHITKDKFLLDIYAAHEKTRSENKKSISKLALLAFYCLVLLSINYFKLGQNNSISHFISNYFNAPNLIWFCSTILLLLVVFRFHMDDRDYVYCPSLYREIEEKENSFMSQQSPPFPNRIFTTDQEQS